MIQSAWRVGVPLVALVVLLTIVYFFGVRPFREINALKTSLETKDFLQLKNSALSGLAQALGGAILLTGLFFTWRSVRATEAGIRATQESTAKSLAIAQEGQITERFTRAIEQLGNQSSLATRLGGIYALEQIAKVSQEFYRPIVELFSAFVRENSRCEKPDSADIQKPGLDIQTILIVLGRRTGFSQDGPRNPLNLIATNLKLITLIDCRFDHAVFARSNLQGAVLSESYFEGASFRRCNMKNVVLEKTHLERANFMGADLQEADFTKAALSGADLVGANLKDANIAGADLSNAHGLTLEQLKTTYGYGKATLPDYLEMAVQSEGETE